MKSLALIALFISAPAAKKAAPKQKNIVQQILDIETSQEEKEKKAAAEEPDTPSDPAMYQNCVDSKNIPVRWEEDNKITDAAQALFDKKKRPLIQYNAGKMRFLRDVSKAFFFAHECGHHALGHLYGGVQGVDKEQQADCWAVHRLKMDDKLQEGDLETIQQDLGKIGRIDENHAAGLRRASNLKWCLSDPMPKAPEPK